MRKLALVPILAASAAFCQNIQVGFGVGLEPGIIRQAADSKSSGEKAESDQTDFHIGPVIGAEYFFIPKMSLGAQVGFSYIVIGDRNVASDTDPNIGDPDTDQSMLANNGKITLRWYY